MPTPPPSPPAPRVPPHVTACAFHPHTRGKTVKLRFSDGEFSEWRMMGGIAFPWTEMQGERMSTLGYAVLFGQKISNNFTRMFAHREFRTIGHVTSRDGATLLSEGLVSWFRANHATYLAHRYAWHEQGVMSATYHTQMRRLADLNPKPALVDLDWPAGSEPEQLIWTLTTEKRLYVPPEFAAAERERERAYPGKLNPPRHAMLCALLALESRPYVAGKEPEEEVTWI